MNKKRLYLLLSLLLLLILSVCIEINKKNNNIQEKEQVNLSEIYFSVATGNLNFFDRYDNEQNVKDLLSDDYDYSKSSYKMIDLDDDNSDELIIYYDTIYGSYLILNYDDSDKKVYGFQYASNFIDTIKENGILFLKQADDVYNFFRLTFDKNFISEINIATQDGNTYLIDDENVTYDEFNEYVNKLLELKDIEFIIEHESDFIDDSIEDSFFKEGVYFRKFPVYNFEEEDENNISLTFENGNAIFYDKKFDHTLIGTYIIDGNKLSINFIMSYGIEYEYEINHIYNCHVSEHKLFVDSISDGNDYYSSKEVYEFAE